MFTYKNKMATSLALISILTFQPTISLAKEDLISNFFTKTFSSKSSTTDQSTKKQIFKSDISSLTIQNLENFKTSIKRVLNNYLDKKKVNSFLKNISDEKDKNLDANSLDQFDNLLPKSSTDKIKGQVLIRLAKKLGKDDKTIFEIKKNIILQVAASQGIKLAYNEKPKATEVVDAKKEDKINVDKKASTSTSWIAGLAGLGLAGGGGGGSYSSSSTFMDESTSFNEDTTLTTTWASRQEYKNVAQYYSRSTIHPYTLIGVDHAFGRGLSGSGKTVAIIDTDFANSAGSLQYEFNGKSINYYGSITVGGSSSRNYHGLHVAGTIGANYNNNSSSYVTDNTNTTTYDTTNTRLRNNATSQYPSGNHGLLNYGTMGVAYNSNLHIADFASGGYDHLANATDDAKSNNAIAQNNSYAMGSCQSSNCTYTIDRFIDYQNNNGTTDSATIAAADNGSTSASIYANYISTYNDYQSTGVVVFAAGNDETNTQPNVLGALPVLATELEEAWLVVGNLDFTGSNISSSSVTRYSNQCGLASAFCIYADGTDITSTVGGFGGSSETGRYQIYSGSSMAAPQVTGAIALLSEAFPNHTPAQLTDRILATANNTFFTTTENTSFVNGVVHGYNAEFGHGLLDLEKALKPITTSMLSSAILLGSSNSENVSSAQRYNLNSSQVNLGAAFGDSLQNSLNGRKAYFYDALNGGFAFNMGTLIKSHENKKNNNHSFNSFFKDKTILHKNLENGMSFMSDKSFGDDIQGSIMTFFPVSSSTSSFLGKNIHLQNALSFTQRSEENINGINSDSPFNIPFIQASENGTSIGNKTRWGNGILCFGMFDGKSSDNGLKTEGFISEYGQEIGSTHTSFFFGGTNEDGGFLETSINGAFADQSTANTTFTGISSYGWLSNDWSYNVLGTLASTHLNIEGAGLLNDIEDVTSSSFAFEISKPIGLYNEDSFHIGISQPLRVETGDASVMIPQLYDTNGNLKFSQVSVDLSPSGRQIDLNFGYQGEIDENLNFGLRLSISENYGHIKSDELVNRTFAFIKMGF